MKIVSYNVNGLRARMTQFKSLRSFLDSLDADIICLQETKIRRQELTGDIALAEGYESFFSCTRTVKKGRLGYSGVATFCRITPETNVSLPVAAEEGFTGLLIISSRTTQAENKLWLDCCPSEIPVENMSKQQVLELDIEGRCMVTDHGHFVLFNIYGPNVGSGDVDRQEFKLNFYKVLQCRLESLLSQQRRVIIVGDFNIAPFPVDSCDPGANFEHNPSRKWLRSMLVSGGGSFSDVFRVFHPERTEAFTCWSQASGAEEFNFGTRIDLILAAGPCSGHCESSCEGFAMCGVENSDILLEFKRTKQDALPRWMGGRNLKLDGSDHAPVYMQLKSFPQLQPHDIPQLAARFMPELRGRQQSIVSMFQKLGEKTISEASTTPCSRKTKSETIPGGTRKVQKLSQSSLRMFCSQRSAPEEPQASEASGEALLVESKDEEGEAQPELEEKKPSEAWEKLKKLMAQQNLPLCRGHGEPCVVRIVKRPGPNIGRGFYVCARAKGPASNPEARCDHFQWTSSSSRRK